MRNFFGRPENKDDKAKVADDGKLFLREEELDIAKNKMRTGEVTLRKEVVEEPKMVDVPVTHEEVVIERKAIGHEPSDSPVGEEESIHIPVSREFVNVDKHTVVTGEVSANKREVQDTQRIEETLKKEKAHIDTEGDPNIVADETDHHFH